jgi:hypothetical protein
LSYYPDGHDIAQGRGDPPLLERVGGLLRPVHQELHDTVVAESEIVIALMSMFFFSRTPVMRSIFPGLFSAKTDT